MKGNLAQKVYSTYTLQFQRMEEIVGVVVEEIDVLTWKVSGSFIEWMLVLTEPLDIH